jgi:hypothetical protein
MHPDIKLILSDIDGTMLPFGQRVVSPRVIASFHAAMDAGIHVGPASGRGISHVTPTFGGDAACTATALATNGMQVCNNPRELKKEIGDKLCFVGGFDTQMMDAPEVSEEQIRASIDQTIDDLAPGGSWVANCSLRTFERNKIVIDEIINYGSTKYTSPRPDLHAERGTGLEGIFSSRG